MHGFEMITLWCSVGERLGMGQCIIAILFKVLVLTPRKKKRMAMTTDLEYTHGIVITAQVCLGAAGF